MPTDPLTASRYPQGSDAPNMALYIQNAVFDLADNTIPSFASTGARDAAYTAWVAAGGAMRDGLFCVVTTVLYEYRSGAWAVVPTDYEVKAMRAQRTTAAPLADNAWTAFGSNTNWTETDPYALRGSGGVVSAAFTGVYQINVVVKFANNATGRRGIRLAPSAGIDIGAGVATSLELDERNPVAGGFTTTLSGSLLTQLTAASTVTLEALQTSGAALDVLFVGLSAAYLGPN